MPLVLLIQQILRGLHARQPQALLNPLHPLPILDRNRAAIPTEIHIQLLQRLVLRLRHHDPHKQRAAATERREEDVRPVLHAVEHVPRRQPNDEVEHPVRRRHDGHTPRAHRVREDLLREHPCDGAPRVREVDAEQPDERHRRPARGAVRWPGVLERAVHGGDDQVADAHPDGAGNQERFAPEAVEEEHGREGEDDLEDAGHASGEEVGGDGGEAEGLEDLRGVVQDGVDSYEWLVHTEVLSDRSTYQ